MRKAVGGCLVVAFLVLLASGGLAVESIMNGGVTTRAEEMLISTNSN